MENTVQRGVPEPCDMQGPFPIVSMTYFEDGRVDYESIAKQVAWADRWGCGGIIFGQSNDAVDLLSREEKTEGFEVCVKAGEGRSVVIGLGVNGSDEVSMLSLARAAEETAERHPRAKTCLVVRPPDDAVTEDKIEAAWTALGAVAKRPVIFQTFGTSATPTPSVEMIVRLAEKFPLTFGYIKEEAAGDEANERMIEENSHRPAIKRVFAGWGGWQWLHQLRQCGCTGLITERVAYAPLLGEIWKAHVRGDRAREVAAFAMYRLMIDQRNFPGGLRGYSLYLLEKEGLARNLVSREYKEMIVTEGGNFGSPSGGWKLGTVQLSNRQKRELDMLYEDMFEFVDGGKHRD